MLQSIRERSQSWVAKVIIGAVIVTMALFGVESLVGLFGNSGDDVASVNGQSITRQQVEGNVQRALRSGQVPPEQERALRGQVLDSLIADRLMSSYAEDGGLHLSDAQLDQVIVNRSEFQDADGRFDQDLFRNRLASAGYTPLSFRAQLEKDLMRQQVQLGMSLSDFTLEDEQQRLADLQRQTRSFRYHTLEPSDLDSPVEVSDEDLSSYYADHQDEFLRPEQVELAYVVVDREAMAADVDVEEADLREAWEQSAGQADRRVSHIMLTFGDERTRDEAEAELDSAKARLDDGDSFADVAAEVSDDTSTSGAGGDLGVITRGIFGEAFESAAFGLDEGQVSDIVETDNGLHLIKVTDIDRPSFEEARPRLREDLAEGQVEDAFNDKVQQLIDESFAAEDLQSVADDLGVELNHSDWVSRDAAEGVLAEPGVLDEAFRDEVLTDGFNSEVIELDADRRLVLRVTDHREATTLPFEQVADRVEGAVRQAKTRDALIDLAAEKAQQLKGGQDLAIDWQQASDVSRQQQSNVPDSVLGAVFRLPHPEQNGPVYGRAVDGNRVTLLALESVGSGEANEQMESLVASMAERMRSQSVVQGLLAYLRDTGEIERQ